MVEYISGNTTVRIHHGAMTAAEQKKVLTEAARRLYKEMVSKEKEKQ